MIFKKVFFLVFCCAFYGAYAAAEEGLPTQNTPMSHPYFWKVEKDGKVSHFLGTLHNPISIDEIPCSKTVRHHLENSDLVLEEIDYLSEKHKEFMNMTRRLMLSTDGREFQALNEKSRDFLRSRGISEQLNLYGYNVVLRHLCNYGVADTEGLILDDQINNIAYSKGISVQELDGSIERNRAMKKRRASADAFNRLSGSKFSSEVAFLNGDIDSFSQRCPPQWHVDMIEHYMSGKMVEYIETAWSHLTPEQRRDSNLGMSERNLKWLDHFEEVQQSHKHVFLAGGLDHFVEESVNLMAMLEDRGYSVEPVSCEN